MGDRSDRYVMLVNDRWLFDREKNICYQISYNQNGEYSKYKEAFNITFDDNNNMIFNKKVRVPLLILKEASYQSTKPRKFVEDNE